MTTYLGWYIVMMSCIFLVLTILVFVDDYVGITDALIVFSVIAVGVAGLMIGTYMICE